MKKQKQFLSIFLILLMSVSIVGCDNAQTSAFFTVSDSDRVVNLEISDIKEIVATYDKAESLSVAEVTSIEYTLSDNDIVSVGNIESGEHTASLDVTALKVGEVTLTLTVTTTGTSSGNNNLVSDTIYDSKNHTFESTAIFEYLFIVEEQSELEASPEVSVSPEASPEVSVSPEASPEVSASPEVDRGTYLKVAFPEVVLPHPLYVNTNQVFAWSIVNPLRMNAYSLESVEVITEKTFLHTQVTHYEGSDGWYHLAVSAGNIPTGDVVVVKFKYPYPSWQGKLPDNTSAFRSVYADGEYLVYTVDLNTKYPPSPYTPGVEDDIMPEDDILP